MKKALIALLIFGAGFGTGVLVTKKHYKTWADFMVDEEVNSLREAYARDEQQAQEVYEDIKKYKEDMNEFVGVKQVEREEGYDYAKYAPDMTVPEDVNVMKNVKVVREEPYPITGNEYLDSMHHYEKIGLYYYDEEQIIADDNEDMLDDLVNIGDDVIDMFLGDDTLTSVYIRNEMMEADYEIVRVMGSYKEQVAGMFDEQD